MSRVYSSRDLEWHGDVLSLGRRGVACVVLATTNAQAYNEIMQQVAALKQAGAQIADWDRQHEERARVEGDKLKTEAVVKYLAQQQSQAAQQQQQEQQQAQWAAGEDDKFAAKHKDLIDTEEKHLALQKTTMRHLEGLGFSPDEIAAAWNSPKPTLHIRDHRVQAALLDLARLNRMEAAARNARPTPAPKPLSPGFGGAVNGGAMTLAEAAERGDMEAYTRLRNKGRTR